MERHSIDADAAFEKLRERSRIDNRKLIDLAAAVVDGHRLLPKQPASPEPERSLKSEPASDGQIGNLSGAGRATTLADDDIGAFESQDQRW